MWLLHSIDCGFEESNLGTLSCLTKKLRNNSVRPTWGMGVGYGSGWRDASHISTSACAVAGEGTMEELRLEMEIRY